MAVITFAHRGARLIEPENTIPAFRAALEMGATGIETDVWLSADGEVVCAHDPVVSRGLRRKRISASTADELAPFGIPRFADVYDELGTAFECSVDVKSADAAEGLVAVGRAHDALERLWVCSPDIDLLRTLRPESRVKLVHSDRRSSIGTPLERHAFDLSSAGIDAARFKRPVVPGDTLTLEAHLERAVRGIGRFRTNAMVGGELVCEAQLLAAIRSVPPLPELPI